MRTVVCVKAVPGYINKLRVSESQDRIEYEAGSLIMNESDEYALEEALVLKKKLGGDVSIITAGPVSSQQVLYVGLAKGADTAIRVDADFADSQRTAIVLAEAIRQIGYDLILTGVESSDNMAAQVGISVAERLAIPFAYAVTKVETGQSSGSITVTKERGSGVYQVLELPLPALLCMQSGTTPLSYTAVRKLLQARSKPVERLLINQLGIKDELLKSSPLKIVDVFSPQKTIKAHMIARNPREVAAILLKRIKEAL